MKPIYTFEIASVNWSTQYLQCFSFWQRTWDLGPGPDHRPDPLMGCKNNIFFENFVSYRFSMLRHRHYEVTGVSLMQRHWNFSSLPLQAAQELPLLLANNNSRILTYVRTVSIT